MCFVDLEKAFDRVPKWILKVDSWKVDSELSEEFEVKVGMHQGSVLSPFIFAVVVDVVTQFAREGALSELLYADDLVLMSNTIVGFRNKFINWKEVFDSKGLKVSLEITKVMVVVVVDPTPPTCCQQSPAPESCGSQQSLPPGGKERLHFVGIRPEVQARKGGW